MIGTLVSVTAIAIAVLIATGDADRAASEAQALKPETTGVGHHVRGVQRIGRHEVTVARHGDHVHALGDPSAGRRPDVERVDTADSPDAGTAAVASAISATCPVVDRTSDDSGNATHPPSSAVIKAIYAYPTDVGNRLGTYGPVIQAGAQRVGDVVASESGGSQSLRFDLGTAAGPGCVDVQRVALSQPSSYYTAAPQSATFTRIKAEVKLAVAGQPGTRNFLVYADGISRPGIAGEAEIRFDDSQSGTFHNAGNLWAMLYGKGGTDFFGSAYGYPPGTTSRNHVDYALHEISHNLGAVQGSAPNRSAFNHCLDEWDVLCYDDDGSGGLSTFVACGSPYSASNQAWDCNKNDFFNPNPPSGGYLATHWNVTRSIFLCGYDQCGPGGIPAGAADPQPAPAPSRKLAPETTILRGPHGKRRSRTATFHFGADAPGASFECQLDRKPPRPCVSGRRYRKLRPGRHTFSVRARDATGLSDPSPATRTFRVIG